MPHLPPELWMQVFALACTDDGSTGRSLSSVSHHFRTLSAPFKYQSLSIRRHKQLISWSHHIHTLGPASKKTKYLFVRCPEPGTFLDISDDEDDADYHGSPMDVTSDLGSSTSSKDMDYEGELDGEEMKGLQEEVLALRTEHDHSPDTTEDTGPQLSSSRFPTEKDMRHADKALLQALRAILQELVHSLIIVSVHWSSFDSYLLEDLFPVLPQLRELYIHRVYTSRDALPVEPESKDRPPLLFPHLRYLHLSGYLDQYPISFGQYLGASCPNILALRVPMGLIPQSEKNHLPESLQVVIIQASLLGLRKTVEELSRSVFRLGQAWSTSRSLSAVYEPCSSSPEQWKYWWADRISGGSGPWALSSDHFTFS